MNQIYYTECRRENDNLGCKIIDDYYKKYCRNSNKETCRNCLKEGDYLFKIEETTKDEKRIYETNIKLEVGNIKGLCRKNYKEEEYKIITYL